MTARLILCTSCCDLTCAVLQGPGAAERGEADRGAWQPAAGRRKPLRAAGWLQLRCNAKHMPSKCTCACVPRVPCRAPLVECQAERVDLGAQLIQHAAARLALCVGRLGRLGARPLLSLPHSTRRQLLRDAALLAQQRLEVLGQGLLLHDGAGPSSGRAGPAGGTKNRGRAGCHAAGSTRCSAGSSTLGGWRLHCQTLQLARQCQPPTNCAPAWSPLPLPIPSPAVLLPAAPLPGPAAPPPAAAATPARQRPRTPGAAPRPAQAMEQAVTRRASGSMHRRQAAGDRRQVAQQTSARAVAGVAATDSARVPPAPQVTAGCCCC